MKPTSKFGYLLGHHEPFINPIRSTPKVIPRQVPNGKKLPAAIKDALASFTVQQPLRLMFQDEARFGRISDCCYCWCKKPLRPLVKAMLSHQYVYAYGAVSPMDGKFDALVMPEVNGDWMQLFLTEIAARYPHENIVMIVDGAGWHKRKTFWLKMSRWIKGALNLTKRK